VPASLADASRVRVAAGDATASALRSEAAALRSWLPRTFGAPLVALEAGADAAAAAAARPLTVGVVFCGRQTPGAHSLVCGLADALAARAPGSTLLGFVGGVRGLLASPPQVAALDAAALAPFRHQGGMHLLGRSVDRVRSRAEQQAALAAATALGLDGLVLVGGTFTASDAAHLAEAFAEAQAGGALRTAVVAAPVTIDGDIKNEFVETTLGHDTATKVFAQLVGNMATDSNSAKKYWYFVKLMGRATGHITMEVALQTRPNVVILAEDIERRKLSLRDVISEIADAVAARAAAGKNFGVVLVPEGAVAAIPEVATLIAEMSKLLRGGAAADAIPGLLTPWSAAVLAFLPPVIRGQFFLERESSGSVQLTQIASETMLAELVGAELAARAKNGTYKGKCERGGARHWRARARARRRRRHPAPNPVAPALLARAQTPPSTRPLATTRAPPCRATLTARTALRWAAPPPRSWARAATATWPSSATWRRRPPSGAWRACRCRPCCACPCAPTRTRRRPTARHSARRARGRACRRRPWTCTAPPLRPFCARPPCGARPRTTPTAAPSSSPAWAPTTSPPRWR
jgi:diphosphate--fructose-6-phosphate 1-phosphotransferase